MQLLVSPFWCSQVSLSAACLQYSFYKIILEDMIYECIAPPEVEVITPEGTTSLDDRLVEVELASHSGAQSIDGTTTVRTTDGSCVHIKASER